jgi:thiol-disulfide isomerase/thioredoxin
MRTCIDNRKRKVFNDIKHLSTKAVLLIIFLSLLPALQVMAMETPDETQQKSTIRVQGRVLDEFNQPLPGVSILAVKSTKGVITDIDGNYSIEVAPDEKLEQLLQAPTRLTISAGDLEELQSVFKLMIEDLLGLKVETAATGTNEAYKQAIDLLLNMRLEANKKKTGYTINQVDANVSNEDLFTSIISKFKGKVLLVDFWATWCGPCRMANKTMAPMKEELKDKDIVYLYITGETSPLKTWENMIPDIHGEHFRLTDAQWKYLSDAFKIEGVPTYLIVDREGNTTFRQTGFPGVEKMKEELLKVTK